MNRVPQEVVAKAQITDALARIHEAMLAQGEQETEHALHSEEPCAQANAAGDAAVRTALLSSEDAMIAALVSLPLSRETDTKLAN